MKTKYLIIIALTAILTIILVQNNEPMFIQILWMELKISKLLVLAGVFIVGLIVGLLWAARFSKKETEDRIRSQTKTENF
jgi:putative membrane protein